MNTASTQHAKKKKKMGKLQKYENYKLMFLAKEFLVMINHKIIQCFNQFLSIYKQQQRLTTTEL